MNSENGGRPEWMTLPNAITVLRFALIAPIAVLIIRDESPVLTLALLVLFGSSDWVDGYLARRLGQTSRLGAAIDPIADRAGVAIIVLAFVLGGHLPIWIAIAVAAVDLGLAAAWLLAGRAAPPTVSFTGKVRTALLMTGIALVGLGLLPGWSWASTLGQWLCGIGAVCHVIAGIGYLRALVGMRRA